MEVTRCGGNCFASTAAVPSLGEVFLASLRPRACFSVGFVVARPHNVSLIPSPPLTAPISPPPSAQRSSRSHASPSARSFVRVCVHRRVRPSARSPLRRNGIILRPFSPPC